MWELPLDLLGAIWLVVPHLMTLEMPYPSDR
jgi:hypothetical protein